MQQQNTAMCCFDRLIFSRTLTKYMYITIARLLKKSVAVLQISETEKMKTRLNVSLICYASHVVYFTELK